MLILMIVPGLSLFIDNLTYLADTLKKKKVFICSFILDTK